jgi:competence ComEA-like helix-hairpin-helix protein
VYTHTDSLPKWPEKKDTVLNLRTTDTTELKMIRGIGSYRAKQIVRYREQLGGFVSVEQLLEVKGMEDLASDSILQHFVLDSVTVQQVNVNQAGVQRLAQHPYLRFEQAKALYELRRKKIRLHSIQDLEAIECIDTKTLEKIAPYLNFDKK